jgi:hypothetical protein
MHKGSLTAVLLLITQYIYTMTPNELTDIIALELRAVNDWAFKRTVLARADAVREQQMKRTLEKTPQDRKFFVQEIQVPMENFNSMEGIGDMVCTWSRNACTLPKPLRANSILYDYVGSVDGSNAYRYTTRGASRFINAGKYAHHFILYHRDLNRLIVEKGGIPKILVVGVFANPEEAYNINAKTKGCTDCDYWESTYPCSGDVLDIIINEITSKWRSETVNLEANGTQNKPDPTA